MKPKTSFYQKAMGQILQIFSANMLKAGAGFAGTIFVLRGWSTKDIGDIYTLVGVLLLLNQIGDLGTGGSFIQLMNVSDNKNQRRLIDTYLAFKHLASLIFIACAAGCFSLFYLNPKTHEFFALGIIFLAAVVNSYSVFYTILITARQKFSQLSLVKVIPPVLKSIFIISLYFVGLRSFGWILFAFLIPAIVAFILGRYLTKIAVYKTSIKNIFTPYGRKLYLTSRWIFLIGFFSTWFSQIDIFMLKRMSNDAQIAQFVGAQRISTVLLMLSQSIFTVMLPKMRSFSKNSELLNLNKKIFIIYMGMISLAYPLTFLAPYLVDIFLGGRYVNSIPLLKVFFFQSIGYMFISTQSLIFYRKDKLPILVGLTALQFALNCWGNYMVIIDHKALGVIWVSMLLNNLFFMIMSLYSYWLLQRDSKNQEEGVLNS